jgi:hypothetical protein
VDSRYQPYFDATSVGEYPFLTRAEVDLTLAEAYLRAGQPGQAATLVNKTRVGNGHLPPVTAAGVPAGTGCVPQVPTRTGNTYSLSCGSLLEAIKYEKRMETPFTSYGNFFFDSRGWGDLTAGTPLQFAVPAQELAVRLKRFYTYGGEANVGGGPANGTAPVGTYGFGSDR